MDQGKRGFFKWLIKEVTTSAKEGASDAAYFDSYENCYPLISEYSYFLEDEVKELGIETEGKSQKELVEEVYEQKGRGKSPA